MQISGHCFTSNPYYAYSYCLIYHTYIFKVYILIYTHYALSHNYVSQSFSVIIKIIVYLRRFPFQAALLLLDYDTLMQSMTPHHVTVYRLRK